MDKIKNYIKRHNLINKEDKIVIGFSGGPDSLYLMLVLLELRQEFSLSLAAVYINHQLLAEASGHEAFARRFCEEHGVPFYCYRKDIASYAAKERLSIEEAGRKFRYATFYHVLEKLHYDSIAVAHHRNDLAETVLYRMARGTGWKGMAGIRPKQNRILRPLLCVTKEEILKELMKRQQTYNVDPSNEDTVYARNQIRHKVIPELSIVNGQAAEHIADLAEQMEELGVYLTDQIEGAWSSCVICDGDKRRICMESCRKLPVFLQKEVLKRTLAEVAGSERDLKRIHVEQLLKLMEAQSGREMDFPYQIRAVRQYDELVIGKREEPCEEASIRLQEGIQWIGFAGGWMKAEIFPKKDEEFSEKMYTKTFDYDKIRNHAVVRTWQQDDYFVMNDKGQRKKLNRYFIDQKIPKDQRKKIPLVADEDHIIWIIGGRISGEYKVTDATKWVLQLTWTRMEE